MNYKKLILSIFIVLITGSAFAQYSNTEKDILKVLTVQSEAWNRGDIDAFMQTYWKSDSLAFVGKKGVTYGWQNTKDNYKRSYPDSKAMGHLQFTVIRLQKLSADAYNLIGKWQLKREMGDLGGYFTLLLKNINGKWLIVQDHTS